MIQTFVTVFFGMLFVAMGRMLIGMGLMKLGVFSAGRSRRFYLWMVVIGYGIGIPLMIFDGWELIQHSFSAMIATACMAASSTTVMAASWSALGQRRAC